MLVLSVRLRNLLRNACLYTERGQVTERIGFGELQVQDTGIGMRHDQRQRVFEPCYRTQNGHRGSACSDGHGIGLSIVQRLSQRFGWLVEIESALGQGTLIRVRFPKAQPIA